MNYEHYENDRLVAKANARVANRNGRARRSRRSFEEAAARTYRRGIRNAG